MNGQRQKVPYWLIFIRFTCNMQVLLLINIVKKWLKHSRIYMSFTSSFKIMNYAVMLFIPCLKKYSQSEALKAIAYSAVSNRQYPTGSILPGFPAITCKRLSKWRQNCCVCFRNGAKVVGQCCESFLYKELKTSAQTVVLVLCPSCVGLITQLYFLIMQCFLMGYRGNVTCIFFIYILT